MDGIGFEAAYLAVFITILLALALGLAFAAWRLKRVNPQIAGALIGALVGIVLLECVPLLT
jgi:pilus assembly protein TadC